MARQGNRNGKTINTQAAMDKAVKGICDILRRDKAKGARLYVPELTWMFFLRFLDVLEQQEEAKAQAVNKIFSGVHSGPIPVARLGRSFDKDAVVKVRSESQAPGLETQDLTETKAEINGFLGICERGIVPVSNRTEREAGRDIQSRRSSARSSPTKKGPSSPVRQTSWTWWTVCIR